MNTEQTPEIKTTHFCLYLFAVDTEEVIVEDPKTGNKAAVVPPKLLAYMSNLGLFTVPSGIIEHTTQEDLLVNFNKYLQEEFNFSLTEQERFKLQKFATNKIPSSKDEVVISDSYALMVSYERLKEIQRSIAESKNYNFEIAGTMLLHVIPYPGLDQTYGYHMLLNQRWTGAMRADFIVLGNNIIEPEYIKHIDMLIAKRDGIEDVEIIA